MHIACHRCNTYACGRDGHCVCAFWSLVAVVGCSRWLPGHWPVLRRSLCWPAKLVQEAWLFGLLHIVGGRSSVSHAGACVLAGQYDKRIGGTGGLLNQCCRVYRVGGRKVAQLVVSLCRCIVTRVSRLWLCVLCVSFCEYEFCITV
jgi:hypothetical protein